MIISRKQSECNEANRKGREYGNKIIAEEIGKDI